MNILYAILAICSGAAVVVAVIITYNIGKLKGYKEVIEMDDGYRKEFEQIIIDFVTEKYERKKDE